MKAIIINRPSGLMLLLGFVPLAIVLPAAAQTRPDSMFRDCLSCPEMVLVPAGSFLMGSPSSEDGRHSDEGPRRRVTIESAFAVGVYEVTFEEWDACAAAGGCGGRRPEDAGWGRGRRPVTNVSWQDGQLYVEWLSEETGEEYRLLTEAEWEYVARAGTETARYWGDSESDQCRYVNGFDRELASTNARGRALLEENGLGVASCSDGQGEGTAPAGSYEPNAFGLYDVLGNLTEWTEDCWNTSYSGGPLDGSAWNSGDCSQRVLRGGTWGYPPEYLRSASRFKFSAEHRDNGMGFRVACSTAPPG